MATYTVQDTTMTALGDAVRNKVMGTTEQPVTSYPKTVLSFLGTYPFEFPAYVKKIKITGKLEHESKATYSSLKGLGIVPFIAGNTTDARLSEDFIIVIEETRGNFTLGHYESDFEIIIDSNAFTFVTATSNNANPTAYLSYTAIGLDENGNEFKYTPAEMVEKIDGLMTIPEEAFTITGDCQYRFAYGGWNWCIKEYGNQITTSDITNCNSMFYYNTTLGSIPFDINCMSGGIISLNGMFQDSYIRQAPRVINAKPSVLNQLFGGCYYLREIPDDFCDTWDWSYLYSGSSRCGNIFRNCYSLRKVPINFLKNAYSATTSYTSSNYYYYFQYCYSLDEVNDLVVVPTTITSNCFSNTFSYCGRLKNMTFETNEDGTPKTANWKNQVISLNNVGSGGDISYITSYNSGITRDKRVTDDVTYEALKNDPDWFTLDVNYSRYNHDSAVNTINSLPDTSAYLASNGGTNTIKFVGNSGALTDGGAINTLTEEEIAVATSRGWTVSLV